MNLIRVLQLLADGEVHSGEEIGEALGVSRTAVWKQLQKLSDLGLSLSTVKSRGYQLPGGLELLEHQKIVAAMSMETRDLLKQLDVENSIDSTNTRAMAVAQKGFGSGYACIAEHQTAGRGRKGRNWVSPFGRNIYLSVVWEFTQGAAVLEGLSLAIGVAIARVINRLSDDQEAVQLKWPNDVYWQGKKLAGVLLEMSGDVSSTCQVVVGVGLNVSMLADEATAIDQQWTSLNSFTKGVSRNQLAANLLSEILLMLSEYDRNGFARVKSEWESLDFFRDAEVEIRLGENILIGRAAGVSGNGALRLLTDMGEQLIYGGEASARKSV
jgi:BirA family biotin operon repressor/biotin-[acetyl-CoA-carboxylase] ligase